MGDIIHRILEFITGAGYWGILLGLPPKTKIPERKLAIFRLG